MHVYSGHLVDEITEEQRVFGAYTKIPENLQKEASEMLNGKKEIFVDLAEDNKITKWAKTVRNKNKAKMIKKSKRNNR